MAPVCAPVASPTELQQATSRASVVPGASAVAEAPLATNALELPLALSLTTTDLDAPAPLTPAEGASAARAAVEYAAELLMAPYRAYSHALETRPLLTKAMT
ncbi:hypothetical protein MNEG_15177, partial [Monoraphidium neglectum]